MDILPEDKPTKELPFNNLFLNAGVVHGLNDWWMYVVGACAAILGYFIYQVLIGFPLTAVAIGNGLTIDQLKENPSMILDPEKIGIDKNLMLAMLLGMFGFALLGLLIVLKKIHHKPFLSVITAYNNLRVDRVFFGFAVWGTLVLAAVFISWLISPAEFTLQFNPQKFIVLFLVTLLIMPIQTSTEEILMRGYLMQGLSQVFKNGIFPLIITSLLFGLLHMQNPEAQEFGWLVMLPYYSFFGAFLGILVLLDEGLELVLGIHFANNFISSLLVTTPNGTLKTDAIFSVPRGEPGQEFIMFIVFAAVSFFVFWLKYRWTNFKLILK